MIYGFIIPGFDNPFTQPSVDFPLWLGIPLTLVWYLGMMNAINFLDGLDGLLSGVTAISGLFLFAIALGHGHLVGALVLCALVGGALGFLAVQLQPGEDLPRRLRLALYRLRLRDRLDHHHQQGRDHDQPARAARRARAARSWTRPPRSCAASRAGKRITDADRGHFHHQSGLSFRAQRAASGAADLRRLLRARRGRAVVLRRVRARTVIREPMRPTARDDRLRDASRHDQDGARSCARWPPRGPRSSRSSA